MGYEFLNFNFGGVSFSVDRFVLLALLGTYLVQWKLGHTSPKSTTGTERALFAFLTLLCVNAFAFGTYLPNPQMAPVMPHLIEGYIIPLILYWIGCRAKVNESNVNRLYAILAVFGVYLSFTACCEVLELWALVFPKNIADPQVGIHFGRARGPFLQSVRLGLFLLAGLAAVWIPLVWRAIWGRAGQLLGFGVSLVHLVALFFTYTRSVWLGVGIASMLLFAMTLRGQSRRLVIVAMLIASVITGLVVQEGFTSFKREYGAAETAQSTKMRAVFAYVSWLMFKDRPLTGHGFGHFQHKNQPYLNDRQTDLQLNTIRGYIHHNTFLSLLVELGILGLLLYAVLLIGWFRRAWRLWRDALAPEWMRGQALFLVLFIPHYACQMMFHDVTYSPLENGLFFFLAGMTSGLCSIRGVDAGIRGGVWSMPTWSQPLPSPN